MTLLAIGQQPAPLLPNVYKNIVHVYVITRGGNTTTSSDCVLLDIDGYIHHFYGIKRNTLVLVRPDGYIGLTGSNLGPQPIIDYLHMLTGR